MFYKNDRKQNMKLDKAPSPFIYTFMSNYPIFFGEDPGHVSDEFSNQSNYEKYTK